jgi:hypothetical protein
VQSPGSRARLALFEGVHALQRRRAAASHLQALRILPTQGFVVQREARWRGGRPRVRDARAQRRFALELMAASRAPAAR